MSEFFAIATRVASALDTVHAARVIHRDIKPDNILFDGRTGGFALLDFNISMRIGANREEREALTFIAGTLPYMAPEQTGRTSNSIDERTDLYSTGVMFYELVTGRLPFLDTGALEVIHQHLTATPPAIATLVANVPAAVVAIIGRLMAKNPTERYQSARGLLHDIERAERAWRGGEADAGFVLGARDIADRLYLPDALYGRDGDLEQLIEAGRRAHTGGVVMVWVTGIGGVGKSSLVEGFVRGHSAWSGLFAPGNCREFQRSVPQKPILDAMRHVLRDILSRDGSEIAAWARDISEAVGSGVSVLQEAIPELTLIVGGQPVETVENLAEGSNRFRDSLRKLIQCIAGPERPLALFIDDLQWADSATLAVLHMLLTDPEAAHLLVIGAYRGNRVDERHGVTRLLADLADRRVAVATIALGDLSRSDLTTMLADTVRAPADEVAELSTLIHKKTHGNPFFARQFISALYQRELLTLDRDSCRWIWDAQSIAAAELTDNVIELLLERMRNLPDPVQEVLQWSGYLGSHCNLKSLSALLPDVYLSDLAGRMLTVVRDGLMTADPATERLLGSLSLRAHSESSALSSDQLENARVVFVHDRVQQAASTLTEAEERAACHLHVGRLLRKNLSRADIDRRLFDIVEHYVQADELLDGASGSFAQDGAEAVVAERVAVAELAIMAARRARAASAYEAGLGYARFAAAMLPDGAWDIHYDSMSAAALLQAVCLSLTGDHEGCDALCRELEGRVRSVAERAELHQLRLQQYLTTFAFEQAMELIFAQLQVFDVEFPTTEADAQALIGGEIGSILARLGAEPGAVVRSLSRTEEPEHRIITTALMAFFRVGYNAGKPNIATLGALRAMSYSLEYGISRSSDYAVCVTGFFMMQFFGQWQIGLELGEAARELAGANPNVADRALSELSIIALITHWHRSVKDTAPDTLQVNELAERAGDYETIGYCLSSWCQFSLSGGINLLHVHRGLEQHLLVLRRMRMEIVLGHIHAVAHGVRALTGLMPADLDNDDQSVNDGVLVSTRVAHELTSALYVARPSDEVLELIGQQARVSIETAGLPSVWTSAAACGLHCARLAQGYSGERRAAFVSKARGFLDTMRGWEQGGNVNLRHLAHLLEAELALCEERPLAALQGYARAMTLAREIAHPGDEGLAAERAAALCKTLEMDDLQVHYLAQARAAYDRWGATVKVAELNRSLGRMATQSGNTGYHTGARSTGTVSLRSLDIESVVKASLAIAREIRLSPLLSTLLRVIMENAGAERAAVLMARGDELELVAQMAGSGEVQVHEKRPRPLADWADGAQSVVRYVQRTRAIELVEDATVHLRYAHDPYVRSRATKSLMCLPVERKGMLLAVLYLENRQVPGAFVSGDAALMGVLAGQISTSLENARLYHELEQAMGELASSERLKHEFLATISHELRTPLNAIINLPETLLQALSEQPADTDVHFIGDVTIAEANDILSTVQQCGQQLLNTIERMILFSRLEAGILTLEPTQVDLGEVVAEVAASLAGDIANKQISLRIDTESSAEVPVRGDSRLLRHVIGNLLANAVKFSPAGSAVVVATRSDADGVALTVRDSGPGIAESNQELIFEMFRQSSAGSRRQHGGTGLGLTVTKRLVALHGGTISVASRLGRGCTFTVRLPR